MADYSVSIQYSDDDGGYIAIVPEIKNLSAFGETPEEALKELEIAKKLVLKVYEEDGCPLPEPDKLRSFSGQTRIRIPKALHASLAKEAKKEGLSLNAYITYLLASQHESTKIEQKLNTIQAMVANQTLQNLSSDQPYSSGSFENVQVIIPGHLDCDEGTLQ